jgi:hypothetical protein
MNTSFEDKKKELELFRAKIEAEEARLKYEMEVADAKSSGLYIPIATAVVKNNLYYKSGRDFEELGDRDWYTAGQILGSPHFKAGTKVVLLKINEDDRYWYTEKQSGDYFGVESDEIGFLDGNDAYRQKYLKDIVELK